MVQLYCMCSDANRLKSNTLWHPAANRALTRVATRALAAAAAAGSILRK